MLDYTSATWKYIKFFFFLLLTIAGAVHLFFPGKYVSFVPEFLPFIMPIIYVSGVIEIALGVLLIFKKTAPYAATGIFILMLIFLPLHVFDMFRDRPAIGSHTFAILRLLLQFVLIWLAWGVKQNIQKPDKKSKGSY